MTRLPKAALLAGALVAAVTPSAAYYHYVHYLNSSPPYKVVYEKFDLNALPDNTVTFFVSDSGPTSYSANDSFPSVVEQIRNATQVWNSVESSSLRVGFGGLQMAKTPQSVPAGEVVFDDQVPPGVLAFAGHAVQTNTFATAADGAQFVPITASLIHLNINLAQSASANSEGTVGPSYSEAFFTTLVHEIGHALGLQHTYTSAAMSTAVSRATNRARPLDADDIAGISLLYPNGGFPVGWGSIGGRVTMNGQGVHMASVVAILPNGAAVSNLSNPDGTYEIDGLPPGKYWVYVHPLPPVGSANILSPLNASGAAVAPSAPFVTTFYPGTWNPSEFTAINVPMGANVSGINFAVAPRSAVEVYDVTSYWWTGSNYMTPAVLSVNNATSSAALVLAQGTGIASADGTTTNVTSVAALGAPGGWLADQSLTPYLDVDVPLLQIAFGFPSTPGVGPEHLLFTLPDDIFVLPWGVQIMQNAPPAVTAVTPNRDGSMTISGTGLSPDSHVFFDSLQAAVTVAYAADSSDASGMTGSVSVMPPSGASNQTATITVYNPDGQNSSFLLGPSQNPFTFTYPESDAAAAAISIAALPEGMSSMVDITTSTMQFADGQTTLGFGSGDIAVRQLWVLNPTHAIANITVAPTALEQETVASVISGFQVYEQSLGFQVMPANPQLPLIVLPLSNAFYPLQNSIYPGSIASLYGQNLLAATETPALTIGGQAAQVLYASPTLITFVVPAGMATGPAVMKLQGALPIVLQIDPPPPVIVSATSAANDSLGASNFASPGDTITLTVSGIDPAVISAPRRVSVAEGGVTIPVFTVRKANDKSGNLLIQFALTASVTGQQVPITVSLDGGLSMPFYINVQAGS